MSAVARVTPGNMVGLLAQGSRVDVDEPGVQGQVAKAYWTTQHDPQLDTPLLLGGPPVVRIGRYVAELVSGEVLTEQRHYRVVVS